MSLLRPPVLRPCSVLNKALFAKTINIAAASIRDNKNISKLRKTLESSQDILPLERISHIAPDPNVDLAAKGRKCLLLKPEISAQAPETWGPVIQELVKLDEVGIVPYQLKLDYDYWSYHDVLSSMTPEELHGDIPVGFNTAGHVAHLNLRSHWLPYKTLIGQVLLEKNPHIKTVINKTDNVGTESQFRTFTYEVLAGPDDMNIEVNESGCLFKFDYSKVYWNSKLEPEHTRLVKLFQPGEVVCDVMAGIGPFAVPAGKRGVFVWANDYNPESYKYLQEAITRNKVGGKQPSAHITEAWLTRSLPRYRHSFGLSTKTGARSSRTQQTRSSPRPEAASAQWSQRSRSSPAANPTPTQSPNPLAPPSRRRYRTSS